MLDGEEHFRGPHGTTILSVTNLRQVHAIRAAEVMIPAHLRLMVESSLWPFALIADFIV